MAGSDIMSIIVTKIKPVSDVLRVSPLLLLKNAHTHVSSWSFDYMPEYKLEITKVCLLVSKAEKKSIFWYVCLKLSHRQCNRSR